MPVSSRISPKLLLLALLAVLPGIAGAATRCFTSDLEIYRSQIRPVPPAEAYARHTGDHPMTPPDNPNVGDSWLWYTWRLNGPPTPELKMCTVRGEGTNVYVVVEDSQWLTQVDQADVDAMVTAWDLASAGIHPDWGIYQLDTTYFGPAPDELDNDPKIYVLYYDFDVASDGFFWPFDEYPDGSQPYASNECEVLYMNSSDFDPGGEYLISVQAHEFQHMIHWLADEDEVAWVNEGMSELAMWLYGHPDTISNFNTAPDNDLTSWNSTWADYIKTYLWSLYFYEQFGGLNAVRTLVSKPANSVTGYEDTFDTLGSPLNFNDVLANWVIANYLDDPALDQGQYGYVGDDLPPFSAITKSVYPVPPTNGSVNRYAADYVRFITGQPQRLRFDGADVGTWRPRVILMNAGVGLQVIDMALDAVDAGFQDLVDFGETYDTVVLAVAKTSPSGSTSYVYETQSIPASVGDGTLAAGTGISVSPNPASGGGVIRLSLERAQRIEASIVDLSGRVVRRLATESLPAGTHAIAWDGCDAEGRDVPAGSYYVRVAGESGEAAASWVQVH